MLYFQHFQPIEQIALKHSSKYQRFFLLRSFLVLFYKSQHINLLDVQHILLHHF